MTSSNQMTAENIAEDSDFDNTRRGFIATLPHAEILNAKGHVVWTLRDYDFLENQEPAPTVHPDLWRHARLNMAHGLFKVTERIYQVRGFDVSNITFVEGEEGTVLLKLSDK